MFLLNVLCFVDVGAEVVELYVWQALFFRIGIAGLTPTPAARTQFQLPVSLPQGEASADTMMHDGFAKRGDLLAYERWQNAYAILASVVGSSAPRMSAQVAMRSV